MTTLQEAQRAVQQTLGTKQDSIQWKQATLGDGHGTVSTGNNMVYCRLSENSSVIEVLNLRVAPIDGMRVRIAKTPEMPLVWQVIGQDDQRVDENSGGGGGANYNLPAHHKTHEYLAYDQVNVDWRQITNLRVYATTGFTVGVLEGLIPAPGPDLIVPSQTIDLTTHIPASGALWCLISVNYAGALVLTDGAVASSLLALTLGSIPDTPTGNFRLAAVRLYAGQALISESTYSKDIRDLRYPQETLAGYINPPSSSMVLYLNSLDGGYTGLLQSTIPTQTTAVLSLPTTAMNLLLNVYPSLDYVPNVTVLPQGTWNLEIVARKATSASVVQLHWRLYTVTALTFVETLIGTSFQSLSLTDTDAHYTIPMSVAANVTVPSTNTLKLYLYGDLISGTAVTTYISIAGDTLSRIVSPSQAIGPSNALFDDTVAPSNVTLTANSGDDVYSARRDHIHALDQSISPTWTGTHRFNNIVSAYKDGSTGYIANSFLDTADAGPGFEGRRSGTSEAAPSVALNGMSLASFGGRGWDGVGYGGAADAAMRVRSVETFSDHAHGSRIAFETTPAGTDTAIEHVSISDKGQVGLIGTARVNRSINLNQGIIGSGGSAPTLIKVSNTAGYRYGIGDETYLVPFEIPYDWDTTSDLIFKLHLYSTNTTASRFVKFQVDYNATSEGAEQVNAATTTTDTGDVTLPTTAYRLIEATITLPAANFAQDDVISIKIARIASTGTAPSSPGDNPVVMSFEIEYIANKLGEAT